MSYGYGPPPPPPPQGPYGYGPPQQPVILHHQSVVIVATPKSGGTAVALELLLGFFFQWFGWGHIYAGNVGIGLLIMFGYWFLLGINIALCFVLVGFVTWPLTWLLFAIISPITASAACTSYNRRMGAR